VDENSTQTKSETISVPEQQTTKTLSTEEKIANGHPYIKYKEQVFLTEKWPNKKCKCFGLGYLGVRRQQVQPKLEIQPNSKCPCNSGKKFKKCCEPLVLRMRMSGGAVLSCECVGKAEVGENKELEALRERMAKLEAMAEQTVY
jgi:hypothetical protein